MKTDLPKLSPYRPFFIESYYHWFVHNNLEVLLLVDCYGSPLGLKLPSEFLENKTVLLDISPDAVDDLKFGSFISMVCYTDAGPYPVRVPMSCVIAMYTPDFPGVGFDMRFHDTPEAQDEITALKEIEKDILSKESNDANSLKKDSALSRSKLKLVSRKEQPSMSNTEKSE